MRPRLYTFRNFLLLFAAIAIFGGLAYWLKSGMPLPGVGVPSTAGKLAFVSDREGGHKHLWMMKGADGMDAVPLSAGDADESKPAWSPDGSTLAFILRKGADDPQVYEVDAKPGSKLGALTHTSSSKDEPTFGTENRIFYLAGGKVTATVADGTETDLIFPTADQVKPLSGDDDHPGILMMGGIADAKLSPDGKRLAICLKTERGFVLLMYEVVNQSCSIIGIGQQIFFRFLPDSRLAAAFAKGSPTREPLVLFNSDVLAEMAKSGKSIPGSAINAIPLPESSSIAVYDSSGNVSVSHPIPFAPDNVAFSPNGDQMAFGISKPPTSDAPGPTPGVILVALDTGGGTPVFDKPSDEIAYSPDGKNIAFVSGGDIYVAATDGSGTAAKNLTAGHGKNSEPTWSPAKPAK